MKREQFSLLVTLILVFVYVSVPLWGAEVLVEAEGFDSLGGWVLDPQFMDQMGSAYLLAHGLGKPVADAKTEVVFPKRGRYKVWVRAKDWVPDYHPGRFEVIVDGKLLAVEFGANGKDWGWEDGGTVEIKNLKVVVLLRDLTGFDGRCDAIYFTTEQTFVPPVKAERGWRKKLPGLSEPPKSAGRFDVVVVGGGLPGCAAALSAARMGCKVALVQNRPVLGGNSSLEIGITPRGFNSDLVSELVDRAKDGSIQAEKVLRAQSNVSLFLNYHALGVTKENNRIISVIARNTSSNEELAFFAPVFIDCTGMAAVGLLAGADVRSGREPRSEFNEVLAPVDADKMHHGNTIVFRMRLADEAVLFPEVPWATVVSKDFADLGGQIIAPGQDNKPGPKIGPPAKGSWLTHFWEYGQWLDPYADAEHIRDHLLRALYGTFATVRKTGPQEYRRLELSYVSHVPASGEFCRLMGDYILTENDIRQKKQFADTVAINQGHFCLHYPGDEYDFRLGDWKWVPTGEFQVPFRCLYSRNIENLMMAGKHISVTHIAGSSTKTMLNGGQHGVAVGAAGYLCKKYGATPREIKGKYLRELQEIIAKVSRQGAMLSGNLKNKRP